MSNISIVTHNSNFHADDVFAVATLTLYLSRTNDTKWRDRNIKIIRTRDEEEISKGDFVVDVGTIHDEEKNRFDHHQIGGAGVRDNGIPYASFGLVWKKYGEELCGSKAAALAVDKKLVSAIDAHDNGFRIFKQVVENVDPYLIDDFFFSFYPTWKEKETDWDRLFEDLLPVARALIRREVAISEAKEDARVHIADAYEKSEDKRLVVLDDQYPWRSIVREYPEALYVIYPERVNKHWHVGAVVAGKGRTFTNRKDLPKEWGGKRDKELADITGVPDAVFCHNKLFLAVAKTRKGAMALAKLALNA